MLLPAVAAEFLVLALPLSMDMVLEPRLGSATTGLFLMLLQALSELGKDVLRIRGEDIPREVV